MPICIECTYPVPQLYHVLSSKKKTDNASSSGGGSGGASKRHAQNSTIASSSSSSSQYSSNAPSTLSRENSGAGGSGNNNAGNSGGLSMGGGGGAGAGAGAGAGGFGTGSNNIINTASSSSSSSGGGFKGGGEAKKGGNSGSGADVRLTQCPRCKRFADKYVEHDFVVLFIDLVLVKPQVYRHLLFNRLATSSPSPTFAADEDGDAGAMAMAAAAVAAAVDDRFDPSIQRLGVLLVLFDVYLTWSAIEAQAPPRAAESPVPRLPILGQYLFYLVLCSLTAVAQHLVVRELSQMDWFRGVGGVFGAPMRQQQSVNGQSPSSLSSSSRNMSPVPGSGSVQNSPTKKKKKKGRQGQQQQPPTATAAAAAAAAAVAAAAAAKTTTTVPSPPPYLSRPPSAASVSYPVNGTAVSGSSSSVQFPTTAATTLYPPPLPPRKNAVSTAIFVSSCMKLFPILMVVWKYEDGAGQLARGVGWAVAIQNIEALRILLGCGYSAAAVLVGLGWLASFTVGQAILTTVGLSRPLQWAII